MRINNLIVLGLLALGTCSHAIAQNTGDDSTPAPNEMALPSLALPDAYIVEVKPGVNPRQVAPNHGLQHNHVFERAARGFSVSIPRNKLAALANDPRVLRIIPDRAISIVGKASGGTTSTTSQTVPLGVQRIGAAPGTVAYTGTGVGVAVVDTGIDLKHRDLQPVATASFSAFGRTAQDDNGHGTHVSGIIAARNNTVDVVGVAPNATLYAVKVLDANGGGSDSSVTAGLDWIAANAALVSPPIRVVNLSLGRAGTLNDNPILHTAVQNLIAQGITVVVAAGNDATLEVSQQVPATYPEVIAVASTTAAAGSNQYRLFKGYIGADTASYFTTDGAFNTLTHIGVTISSPGEDQENITQTGVIQTVGILSTKLGGGTTRMSGTSMASPHTAGVAALIWEKALRSGLSISSENIRYRLMTGASNLAAPFNSPTANYTFDGVREGILYAPSALAP